MQGTLNVSTPTDREIVMTRLFDAPRQLVWDAMTQPELLRKWLFSPPGWTMVRCDDDLRVGGHFHWQWEAGGSTVMTLTGEYREVAPPAADGSGGRIVRTERGCLPDGGSLVATLELSERPGATDQTELTMTLCYPSKETRDTMLEMGMTQGMEAGYDQLNAMVAAPKS